MKKVHRDGTRTGGFTLIELMIVVVAIISILVAIVSVSYDTLIGERRVILKVKADMDSIAQAAYNDYTTTNNWAPIELPGDLPASFAANGLATWPTPPCPGWITHGIIGADFDIRRSFASDHP